MKRRNTVTLKDISQRTGFSINTVSRTLKGKEYIAEETRTIIMNTAKELGYIGNSLAGALRSGVTGTVAIIISDVSNPLFGIMVKDLEDALAAHNYCAFVLNTGESIEQEERALHLALSKKVDGIVWCPTREREETLQLLRVNNTPFVLMGRHFEYAAVDSVVWDDKKGGMLATNHLLQRGHRNILFLNGPEYISSARERLEGYMVALGKAGVPYQPELVHQVGVTSEAGRNVISRLIQNELDFTAVFAFSDMLAWEVIDTLQNSGYKVPTDIAVIGFDNIQSRLILPYPLTSVSTPKKKLANKVVELLMNRIHADKEPEVHNVLIDTDLVVRSST